MNKTFNYSDISVLYMCVLYTYSESIFRHRYTSSLDTWRDIRKTLMKKTLLFPLTRAFPHMSDLIMSISRTALSRVKRAACSTLFCVSCASCLGKCDRKTVEIGFFSIFPQFLHRFFFLSSQIALGSCVFY